MTDSELCLRGVRATSSLALLLRAWGQCQRVNFGDLLEVCVLMGWGLNLGSEPAGSESLGGRTVARTQ